MRVHIDLDESLLKKVDEIAGPRGRSAFVRDAIEGAVEQSARLQLLRSAAGSIPDTGHEWDDDPAEWVHRQRFGDPDRVG
ncbi:MAG: ribbon-helix-helix domain-containing protein [Actinomycetota bacterium]